MIQSKDINLPTLILLLGEGVKSYGRGVESNEQCVTTYQFVCFASASYEVAWPGNRRWKYIGELSLKSGTY